GAAGPQAVKLRVKFDSQDIEEARQIAEQVGLKLSPAQESDSDTNPQEKLNATGRASFDGTVEGAIRAPAVQGQLFVERLVSGQEEIGQFSGRIKYSPGELSIAEAAL